MSDAILVLVERLEGAVVDITFEMLGAARRLADARHAPVYAVVLGPDADTCAGQLGAADGVLAVDDAALQTPSIEAPAAVLAALIAQKQPALVLLGGTNTWIGLGPRLAAAAHMPFINFCRNLTADDGSLVVTCQLFGGKLLADVRPPEGRAIVSVSPGMFPADAGKNPRSAPVERVTLPAPAPRVAFKRFVAPAGTDVDITKQDVLVAVGRGIQTQDNLALAEEVAAALGGVLCASRPVIDQGWLPLSRQVGKSGLTVHPRLYLAVGISGAPEHCEGMRGAQNVIAINTDPNAPIFACAHIGAVADAIELLPLLTEKLKARKG